MGQRLNPFGVLQVVHLVRQDLSIAGKRAGLAGARSGLFMEQVRIVKEMREADKRNGRTGDMVRPRYLVWENVVGAFSSNKGKDFAAVLEEIIKIVEPEAPGIEVPEKGWPTWGGYHDEMGGRWSVVWRTHDAQHWGVPQRRRRISVVADFGGDTASEIQFDGESVSGHLEKSGAAGEETAGDFGAGADCTISVHLTQDPITSKEKAMCISAGSGRGQASCGVICMATQQGGAEIRTDDRAPTLTAAADMSGNNQPVVCAGFKLGNSEQVRSIGYQEELSPTLNAECGGNKPAVVAPVVALDMTHACDVIRECGEKVPALQARMGTGGNQVPLTYQMNGFGDYRAAEVASSCKQRDFKDSTDLVCAVDCRNFREGGEVNGTLQAKESGQSLNLNNTVRQNMVVRRLTPMECERLQGFPDGWTDIGDWVKTDKRGREIKVKGSADSPRYKALGNSIALPFWDWMLRRMSRYLLDGATLGSLFDGIAGYPLIWERIHGKGTARWASEIEPFPIAVTKKWFGEE